MVNLVLEILLCMKLKAIQANASEDPKAKVCDPVSRYFRITCIQNSFRVVSVI